MAPPFSDPALGALIAPPGNVPVIAELLPTLPELFATDEPVEFAEPPVKVPLEPPLKEPPPPPPLPLPLENPPPEEPPPEKPPPE